MNNDLNLSEYFESVVSAIASKHPDTIIEVSNYQGDTLITVKLEAIHGILNTLKTDLRFLYFCDMLATDRFTSEDRFEVIYNLVCLKDQKRIFIKTRCSEEDPTVPTVTDIWPAANWHEREAYDMFGIHFEGHPDLRRLFMPEDFKYHPLRKEFPLLGIPGSIELPSTTPDNKA